VEIRIAKLEKELQRQRDLTLKGTAKGRSPSRGSTKGRAQSQTSKGRSSRSVESTELKPNKVKTNWTH